MYEFPHHYIPSLDNGNFSQAKSLRWGYEYLSYLYFILEKLKTTKFNSLLDVGCGDGRFLHEVNKVFPDKELVGIDLYEKSVAYARAFNPGIKYICGDITKDNFLKNKFDVVTLIETLEHIPINDVPSFVEGLHRHLKDKGTLILTVPTKNIKVNPKHYQHFDLESLSNALKPLFKISKYKFINKKSKSTKWIQSVLVNKFFILNNQTLLNMIYRHYQKNFLDAEAHDGTRILAICSKSQ